MGIDTTVSEDAGYRGLVEAVGNGAFAFIGAGVSRELGYPEWKPLLERLHDECVAQGANATELDEVRQTGDYLLMAMEYEKVLGRKSILDAIVKTYGPRDEKTSPLHRALIDVDFDHYLTTNYDLGIESAHAVAGIPMRTLDIREPAVQQFIQTISSGRGVEKTVLHIHGRVDQPDSVVLALRDYRGMYVLDAKTLAPLRHLLYGKSFVFIGYNLGDPPFNVLLNEVAALNEKSDRPQHWVVMGKPSNPEGKRLQLKANYNIEPIYYEVVDGRHDALLPLIEKLAADVAAFRAKAGRLGNVNVIDTLFGASDTPVTRAQAMQRLRKLLLPSKPSVSTLTAPTESEESEKKTPLDLKIDALHELMKEGFYARAMQKFEGLLGDLPEDAENRLRYRLHANIGHCLLQLDRRDEMVTHYEAAYANAPQKPDARWMHAFIAELQGDLPEALRRAEALCKDEPKYARGHTIRIRCSLPQSTLLDLKRSTPREFRRDAEVAAMLSGAADQRGKWREAEAYARQVVKASPDWAIAYSLVGAAIMKREMEGDQPAVDYHVVPLDRVRVNEALDHFTKTIEMMAAQPPHPQLAIAYINRAGVRRLLGDDDGARQDTADAYRVNPTDITVVTKHAHAMEQAGKYDEAISLIQSLPEAKSFTPARFMRVISLARRQKNDDLNVALVETMKLIDLPELDEIERSDAHAILCMIHVELGQPLNAVEHLRKLDPAVLAPGLRDGRLAAFLYRYESKDSEEALSLLASAINAAKATAPWFARREIAGICALMGRFRDAADIKATIISPRQYSEETDEYLDCLLRSNQYAAVREYCKVLRSNSQYTEGAMHCECDALYFSGETKDAIELLDDWLAWRPNDKIARLQRSALLIARGEVANATFDPNLLPSIDELRRPHDGVQVVKVLRHGPNFQVASDYAHRLAQKYTTDEEVQYTLITTIMMGKPNHPETVDPAVVRMQHAVTLRSPKGDGRRTVKLVNEKVQHSDEFDVSDEVARNLLGKRIGESVTLGQDEMIIESVMPTAALAAKDAMEVFNLRFPKSKLIRKIMLPTPPLNPTSAREILGEEWWQIATAEDQATTEAFQMYHSGRYPLTMVARLWGKSIFETAIHVVNSTDMEVLSTPEVPAPNTIPFINRCLRRAQGAKTVVIDATALATIFLFDMSGLLKELPFRLIVPDSVLQEVRTAKYEAEQGLGSHRAGLHGGKFIWTDVSPESMKAWVSSLQKLIDDVQSACEIVGGSARERVSIQDKELLEDRFAESGFDAIAIAVDQEAVIWTDDQMFGRIAHDFGRVSPIWTQALLHVAGEPAKQRWRGHYLPELLLCRFRHTTVFILDVAQSLERFKWKLEAERLAGVREYLKKHGCTRNNYDATRNLFVAMWMPASRSDRGKVSRAIWRIMDYFDEQIAKKHLARVLYKPSNTPLRKITPAWNRFRNVFRLWACAPQKVKILLKRR